jgi:peroxiredoxin
VYIYLAVLALLQAPAQQPGIPLIEHCSDPATVLAYLAASAPVEVRSSVAGDETVCYAVTAVVDGKPVDGYVQGDGLGAVAEFERRRATAAAVVNAAPAAAPAPDTGNGTAAPSIPHEKHHYPPFKDFSATDMNGRPVSVHSLRGKVNLVCFWSPRDQDSSRELLVVTRLYGQFKQQGVDALAVSVSGDLATIKDALDDYRLGFRNVPSGSDIAARYNIDYETVPRTYVLNENFEVVASELHNEMLEDLVKELVRAK